MSAQYFATFFINECRKNGNQFSGPDEENRMLIYNFPAKYTGYLDTPFQQSYLFKSDVDYAVVNEAEVEKNVIFLDVWLHFRNRVWLTSTNNSVEFSSNDISS